ncbi:MAG: ROK family protein [Clostridia bacterium]|nr:ROK family protein [Clostridia bacterium]
MVCRKEEKYYVGIDLGGTFIKGGVVDGQGNLLVFDKTPTEREKGGDAVANNIASLAVDLTKKAGICVSDVVGLGIGSPGMIDSKQGVVIFSANLDWTNFPIVEKIEALTGWKVKVVNDANVAALGEVKFGAAKGYRDVVMLTLGTGVGGGVVLDGKLMEGNQSAGAELGHMSIVNGGEPCTCGRKGCLEAYAAATSLIRDCRRMMEAHSDCRMWEVGSLENVTGKTAFDYRAVDGYAAEVVNEYIEHLACGITNFANIFRPQAVILGGGVCNQGEELTKPLQEIVDREIFAGKLGPSVPILIASLGNRAGLLGAAALMMD